MLIKIPLDKILFLEAEPVVFAKGMVTFKGKGIIGEFFIDKKYPNNYLSIGQRHRCAYLHSIKQTYILGKILKEKIPYEDLLKNLNNGKVLSLKDLIVEYSFRIKLI